jgi:hypothetical protein
MNTLIRLTAVAVTAAAIVAARAEDLAATGKVLVLDNLRVLEGDVTRVDDQYRVARAVGETFVPAAKVLVVCSDLPAAYQFLQTRSNLRDASDRLHLARWCHANGLTRQAADEAQAALALEPNRVDCRELAQRLRREAARTPGPVATSRPVPPAPAKAAEEPEPVAVECGAETLALFTTKVQPILMNTCVACHHADSGRPFRLERVAADSLSGRRATQQNLMAAMALVSRQNPADSPLLVKAVTPHGTAALPPLRNPQTPAFRLLEQWARLAANDRAVPTTAVAEKPAPAGTIQQASAVEPAPTKPAGGPTDPFDPAAFNRQTHPDGKPGEAPPKR